MELEIIDSFLVCLACRNHVEKVHEGVFLSRCKHCPETFLNNVLRKQHIKKFHPVDSNTEGKEWVCCEACGKSVRKCYMANHMTQWHSEKNVQCSQCSEMFTSNTSLKRHVLLKHSEITCQLCGKVFPELNYKRHVWSVHTPEDQVSLSSRYGWAIQANYLRCYGFPKYWGIIGSTSVINL